MKFICADIFEDLAIFMNIKLLGIVGTHHHIDGDIGAVIGDLFIVYKCHFANGKCAGSSKLP